jgi:DNA-binding HxlR family transcriptional regulator
MDEKSGYGQFCPLAMAAEFLCTRWTVLVLRELLLGSVTFNDISRGVSRMSRTLLSKRLKELEQRGLITKSIMPNKRDTCYQLTTAGQSLSSVVFGMADWSQEWLHIEPALKNISVDHLLWSLRRSANYHPDLPKKFTVHIYFPEQPESKQNGWLIFDEGKVDLCIIDHGFDVDVQIEVSAETLTKVFMGWQAFEDAKMLGELKFKGPKRYIRNANLWLGHSRLANIKKQPLELRVS